MRNVAAGLALVACIMGSAGAAESVKPDPQPAAGNAAQAGKPANPPMEFETPPVPDFMLKKPDKPLSVEEMKRQAEEAAERARRAKAANAAKAGAASPPPETGGKAGAPSQPGM